MKPLRIEGGFFNLKMIQNISAPKAKDYLKKKNIKIIDRQLYSQDLSPIENVWVNYFKIKKKFFLKVRVDGRIWNVVGLIW